MSSLVTLAPGLIDPVGQAGQLIALAGGGAVALRWGYPKVNRWFVLQVADPTDVEDLQPGVRNVVGTVEAPEGGQLLEAPVTDRECCYYELEVFEGPADPDQGSWSKILSRTDWTAFDVDDGTGRVRVDPGGRPAVRADLEEEIVTVETFQTMTDAISTVVNSDSLARTIESSLSDAPFGRPVRMVERALEADGRYCVVGQATETDDDCPVEYRLRGGRRIGSVSIADAPEVGDLLTGDQ